MQLAVHLLFIDYLLLFVFSMLSSFLKKLPARQLWLANILFWLILNTVASYHSYRMAIHWERPAIYTDMWLTYIPWWGNWALIAPLIIAFTSTVKFSKNRITAFIFQNVLASIILLFLYWGITVLEVTLINQESVLITIEQLFLSPLHLDFIVYLAILCIGYSLTYYETAKEELLKNEKLSKQLIQIELHSLKSQLNPHFLFNTLNTVASLIRLDDKSKAIKALSELSLMLRRVLENQNNQLVLLQQEIEFIESYLTIQKMRFEKKLETTVSIEGDPTKCEIPFMLLQTLVENAVQHGSQLESNKNQLRLTIKIKTELIEVTLVNKAPEEEQEENKGFGIGLKNCRQRLTRLYGSDFLFSLTKLDNGYFETLLSLPKGVKSA